jgi:hypothetical protein
VLAHGASSTFPGAASALRSLREDLLQARVLHGNDVRLLVIDPPERASGLAILDGAMPLLLDPALAVEEPSSIAANRPPQRTWVRPISLRALFALVPQTEFDELRRAKLVLVFPEALVHPGAAPPEKRTWMRVSEPSAENARVFWRELARSKLLDLDPLAMRCVRVLALPAASTAEAPELDWRASSEAFKYGVKSGVWSKESATDGPVAMFDLSRSFPWLCGKVVRSLSIQQAQAQIVYSEALADAPSPPSAATIAARGDDWIASVASEALPRPIAGDARWVLELLDLSNYRFEEFQAEPSAAKEIVFRGAAVFERTAARARNPIAWTLAYRVGETDLLRQRGRRP